MKKPRSSGNFFTDLGKLINWMFGFYRKRKAKKKSESKFLKNLDRHMRR